MGTNEGSGLLISKKPNNKKWYRKLFKRQYVRILFFLLLLVALYTLYYNADNSTQAMSNKTIKAKIYDTQLEDLANTVTVQKLLNNTRVGGETEMLFSFVAFDLTGTTGWTLMYGAEDKSYSGRATFTVDNLQAAIVARKPDGHDSNTSAKFAVTAVNGLAMTVLGARDPMCESIVKLAGQRVPEVLERSLEAYVKRYYFESVLTNKTAIVGERDQ